MARLPQPGSDDGTWGDILNDFLSIEHNADGTLKDNSVTTAKIADGNVTPAKLSFSAATASDLTTETVARQNAATTAQVALSSTYTGSHQEGGFTIMAGTFTPTVTNPEIEVDTVGSFQGWGGGYISFSIGVLPSPAPTPWEPGGKNRITKANNLSNSGLSGVTEYQFLPVGHFMANVTSAHAYRRIIFGQNGLPSLTSGRTYQWELRGAGVSYFKSVTFESGSQPKALAVSSDGRYIYTLLGTSNKLAIVQTGWGELWQPYFGEAPDMMPIARIGIGGSFGTSGTNRIVLQPKQSSTSGEDYVALLLTNNNLSLIDVTNQVLSGTYALPNGDVPMAVIWSNDGTKLYVGCQKTDTRYYRFDLTSRTFDQTVIIDSVAEWTLPHSISSDGRYLYINGFVTGKQWKVDLQASPAPTGSVLYTGSGFALNPVRLRTSTGELLAVNGTTDQLLVISAAGSLTRTIDISDATNTSSNQWASLYFSGSQQQVYVQNDGMAGWFWIDSGQKINYTHSFGTGTIYGDIAATSNDGIFLAVPSARVINHWPGGTMYIRPDPNNTSSFGAEHAIITFKGATANGS